MRLTILIKGLLIIALPLLCQVVFTCVYFMLISDATASLKREAEWQEVLTVSDIVSSDTQRALTYSLLAGLEGTDEMKARQRSQMKKTVASLGKLKEVLRRPTVKKSLQFDFDQTPLASKEGIKRILMGMMMLQRHNIDRNLPVATGFANAGVDPAFLVNNMMERQQNGQNAHDIIAKAQDRLKKEEAEFDKKSREMNALVSQIMMLNAGIAVLLAGIFFYDISRRIFRVRKNVRLLSENKFPEPPAPGSDEISDLDKSVHDSALEIMRLEQFKKQMLGVVSHELKTPLSSVQGIFSMLVGGSYGAISERAAEHCSRSERNCGRLLRLVDDLLALEQMEGKEFKLNPQPVSLTALILDAFNQVESLATARKIELRWQGKDYELIADGQRLLQVVINLLSNAIKFADAGSFVSVETKLLENERLEVLVRNTGREIPAEKKAKLFQRFSQVEASDGTGKGGSGIGLTIAKTIVEQHRGEIGFDSDAKETCFWFRIPLSYVPEMKSVQNDKAKEQRKFGLLKRGLLLVGLPLLINLLFLFALKGMWVSVENNLAKTRTMSDASTGMFLLAGSSINLFWLNVLSGTSDDLAVIALRKSGAADQKRDLAVMKALAKRLPASGLSKPISAAEKLASEAERLAAGKDVAAKDLQAAGLFDLCPEVVESTSKVATNLQAIIKREHAAQLKNVEKMQMVLLAVPVVNIFLSVILAVFFAKSIRNRLLNVAVNSGCLSKKQPLLPPLSGNDEIADLDRYFHEVATQLMSLDEFKEQMIGVASHELRSPLSAMLMSITMLEAGAMGELSEKALDRLSLAEEESSKLIRMINNLLDFEKFQAGKLELEKAPRALTEILSKAVLAVKQAAESAGVEIESKPLEISVNCDSERVVQALVNILASAIKQSPRGGKVILRADQKENILELSVSDQGKANWQDRREKLFNKEYKMGAQDYELGGTGLGLSLSKALIEGHDGQVEMRAGEEQGSVFACFIPL